MEGKNAAQASVAVSAGKARTEMLQTESPQAAMITAAEIDNRAARTNTT